MKSEKPDEVILAAAKVGGIHANITYPAEFIYQNLQIQNNIIHAAHINDVQKLLFLGSSCIYPRQVQQPMREDALLTGVLEPTNEPYAIAKIAGIKMCESYNRQYGRDYRSVMPTNLYGPGDNYHPENSHVVPALIRRFHEANVGTGTDVTIKELAETIKEVVGFTGTLVFDRTKPDGTPRKLLDTALLKRLGFSNTISLKMGLEIAYENFTSLNGECRSKT